MNFMMYNANIEQVFYIGNSLQFIFQERIIMCRECKRTFCSPPCPNYTGYTPGVGYSQKACSSCESEIFEEDYYYSIFGENLCTECVENMSMQEFAELFGFSEISYLIEELGGEYRRD